jgi:hypothetical protein
VRQHAVSESSLASAALPDLPCGSSRATTRDASDRLLPSHVLRTSTRASPVPAAHVCTAGEIACLTSERFASVGRTASRWALSSPRDACVRTSGIPVAIGPVVKVADHPGRPPPNSVNHASPIKVPDSFHRARAFAPQRPFGRPARAFPGSAAWPPRLRLSTPLHPRRILADPPRARLPSTRPAANGRRASLSLGVACRLLQPETTRGHTLRAFNPRTRAELSLRSPASKDAGLRWPLSALPHRRPASDDLHAPACARRVPLARTRQIEGRGARAKANRALLDDVARALLVTPRAPGSPIWFAVSPGGARCSPDRPRSLLDVAPRRATPLKRTGVPSSAPESLRERRMAPPCAPEPGIPSRRLRRGIARGCPRLCSHLCSAFL